MAIRLTKSQINRGISRAMNDVVRKADTNKTGVVYDREVANFSGSGKALLSKAYAFARHVEGGTEGDDFVRLATMRSALRKLGNALKNIAENKGNKDGALNGSELRGASTAAAALARWIHATK